MRTPTASITPLAIKPDFRAVAMKVKDPTAALRQRRARRKRKAATAVTVQTENLNENRADVTVGHGARHGVDVLAYVAALGLAGAAAWFSIRGMVVLSPGRLFPSSAWQRPWSRPNW